MITMANELDVPDLQQRKAMAVKLDAPGFFKMCEDFEKVYDAHENNKKRKRETLSVSDQEKNKRRKMFENAVDPLTGLGRFGIFVRSKKMEFDAIEKLMEDHFPARGRSYVSVVPQSTVCKCGSIVRFDKKYITGVKMSQYVHHKCGKCGDTSSILQGSVFVRDSLNDHFKFRSLVPILVKKSATAALENFKELPNNATLSQLESKRKMLFQMPIFMWNMLFHFGTLHNAFSSVSTQSCLQMTNYICRVTRSK
jgi:hypothetical protein